MAKPAKAFYLEVPPSVQNLFTQFKTGSAYAQEATTATTPPPPTNNTQSTPPSGMMPPPPTGSYQPMSYPDNNSYQTQPNSMPPQQGMMPPPSGDSKYSQYQGGQNMYGGYPNNNNGATNNQPPMMKGGQPTPYGDQGQGMSSGKQGMMGQNSQNNDRQMMQMKRGISQMARQVKQFEQMITSAQKKGMTIPDDVQQNLAKLKSILDSAQNAQSQEDLQNVDMSEVQDLMQSLDDFRRNTMEAQQKMDGMKRGIKGMEQSLKMFKTQIARLTKQNIAIPADLTENISQLETFITTVNNAKTSEDMDAIDFGSMQDLMQNLDQNRQQLEVLARWPQTLKQVDRQLSQLNSALKRAKSTTDSLAKKGIDVQSEYSAFAEAVDKLKSVRDDAVAKMADGNSEDAFSTLQDDFFGQMDDVMQYQKVIMTMSNLGRFSSDFKRSVAQANTTIKNLKRQKIDTSDVEDLLSQINDKGQEILSLSKATPLDEDTVTSALDDLENLKQEFQSKVSDLTGQESMLPWEQGPQQFQQVQLPQGFDQFVPQTPTIPSDQSSAGSNTLQQ